MWGVKGTERDEDRRDFVMWHRKECCNVCSDSEEGTWLQSSDSGWEHTDELYEAWTLSDFVLKLSCMAPWRPRSLEVSH